MRRGLLSFCVVVLLVAASVGSALGLPPVQRTVLANGLVLLVSEEHSLPFITVNLLVGTGSKDDPPGEEGLADLTASSLLLGAEGRTLQQINEEIDFMGAHLGAGANRDYTTVSLRILKKDLERAFPLFMDVLTKPTFPGQEIEKDISRIAGAIQASEDRPGVVAERAFQKALYLGGPYGHPTEGTKESVKKLTREMVEKFHRAYYHPNNSILTVVGDIDEKTVKGYMGPLLAKWPSAALPERRIETRFAAKRETIKIDKPVTQSNIIIGNGAMSRDNPDYYAAVVMNHMLGGGGLTSRLMEDIRNKRGLAYSVASAFDARKYPGPFLIVLQTKNRSAPEAMKAAMEDVERMRTELVTVKELDEAKQYLIGSFPQRLSTQDRIASFYAQVEYYGLGLDYPQKYASLIGGVTREDVLRVGRAYIHPDAYVIVIVADLKEAGME